RENRTPRAYGMDDAAGAVEDDDADAKSVKDCEKAGRLGLLAMDGLVDQQRAANMGYDQRHAPAHLVVDHTARLMPNDAEQRAACRRSADDRGCHVDPAARLRPLVIEAAKAKFIMGHEI